MFFAKLFGRTTNLDGVHRLYEAAVMQAREPVFYRNFAVPDTLEGRFEMIAFHVFLILRRLKRDAGQSVEGALSDGRHAHSHDLGSELGQALFDLMFADMDRNLREMGAGDLGVGRRVKAMAAAFYGRIKAYDTGLAAGEAALSMAIARNVFNETDPALDTSSIAAKVLARYMAECVVVLENLPEQALTKGEAAFASLPVMVPAP
jgi:cytochrome b pre-mRNA-processing protein 3